jgi:holo-[acyl-carrier protein] synthase
MSGSGGLVGIGLDSVEVGRFRTVLARRPTLADRLFTAQERADAASRANPVPSLAARFAVKEAAMKALGVGLGAFEWGDVEVVRQPGGAPALAVRGRAAELAGARGVATWYVSITHTDLMASAVVAACGAPPA